MNLEGKSRAEIEALFDQGEILDMFGDSYHGHAFCLECDKVFRLYGAQQTLHGEEKIGCCRLCERYHQIPESDDQQIVSWKRDARGGRTNIIMV
jgi:hypothetical protein